MPAERLSMRKVREVLRLGLPILATTLFMMLLELLVAFLQAYIFALLTSVFIGMMQHAH